MRATLPTNLNLLEWLTLTTPDHRTNCDARQRTPTGYRSLTLRRLTILEARADVNCTRVNSIVTRSYLSCIVTRSYLS